MSPYADPNSLIARLGQHAVYAAYGPLFAVIGCLSLAAIAQLFNGTAEHNPLPAYWILLYLSEKAFFFIPALCIIWGLYATKMRVLMNVVIINLAFYGIFYLGVHLLW